MKNSYLLLSCLAMLFWGLGGQTEVVGQCPSCTINLPTGIPVDTIVVDSLPPAYKNAYYEETMSYRLPHTTTPLAAVAPPGTTVPSGYNIDHFKVLSVTGLPPGLSWTGDRPTPMLYDEASPQPRDGCITMCGIPGASGTFIVNVNLEIKIALPTGGSFIFPSPPLPLEFIVYPDTNASFTLDTAVGCVPFGAVITNKISSNGNTGFSYFWDFGNGTTSVAENPDTVWYDFGLMQDTVVAIHQQVVIDTFPYMLETIVATVTSGDCADNYILFTGAPDLYIKLTGGGDTINTDPNYALVGNTENDSYGPDTMSFPGPLVMQTGANYKLEIWDDDSALSLFDQDDPCGGALNFSTALGVGVHTLTSGGVSVQVTISHYIDTVTYVDSVRVQYCNVPISYLQQVDRSLQVFPNPTSDLVNVRFQLNGVAQNVELTVSDLLGRTVYSQTKENFDGEFNNQISLDNQANGVYILQLRIGNELLHRKIVLRK